MKIAIATYKSEENIAQTANEEDIVISNLLKEQGFDVSLEVWNEPAVHWQDYDLVIIKSTWDYHQQIEIFKTWLIHLQELQVKVLNPVDVLLWNCDKHYLRQVQQDGLPVIPSIFIEKNQAADISTLFDTLASNQIIIKPCVSAGSKNTFNIHRDHYQAYTTNVQSILEEEALIAQPFVPQIAEEGEWSFLFFNGSFSHAIIKTPKPGDFRVQEQFGGSTHTAKPTQQQIDTVTAYVSKYAKNCLYARVDGVMQNQQFLLMELELIEPYLFLSSDPGAAGKYVAALKALIPQAKAQMFS